jgi:phytoene dehydrogenase-like protein
MVNQETEIYDVIVAGAGMGGFPNQTPFAGIYLCGDTVFPGQGIPGVTLSGINVYLRVLKYLNKA